MPPGEKLDDHLQVVSVETRKEVMKDIYDEMIQEVSQQLMCPLCLHACLVPIVPSMLSALCLIGSCLFDIPSLTT